MSGHEPSRYATELAVAVEAARAAAHLLMRHHRQVLPVQRKADGSPVTAADMESDRAIRAVLADAFPDDPVMTEEQPDDPARRRTARCWIVDPLDGTQQFVQRTGMFDVLIALVIGGRPVVGVICHPPSNTVIAATAGGGTWQDQGDGWSPLQFMPVPSPDALRLTTSVWYSADIAMPGLLRMAAALGVAPPMVLATNVRPAAMLMHREYDAFVGLAPTGMLPGGEWDFAAPDLVFHEAGGTFTDLWGRQHRYNKVDPRNRGGLIVAPDRLTHERMLAAVRPELPLLNSDVNMLSQGA